MAGNKAGGIKAAITNKAKHGADFYAKIGQKGGRNGFTGGFATDVACNCEFAPEGHFKRNCAGAAGGKKSKRGKNNAVISERQDSTVR